LGFEKSQRSVTHDSLRYINILTYLLTYLVVIFCDMMTIWYRFKTLKNRDQNNDS